MDEEFPFRVVDGGVRLAVRLTPRAKSDGLDGVAIGADGRAALRLRLAAPPVEGAANTALIAWLADALGVRKSDIVIRSGETSRQKTIEIAGDGAVIAARVLALIRDTTRAA